MRARVGHPCGSERAYQAHWRRGQAIDDACRLAHNAHMRARRRTANPGAKLRIAARASAMEALRHRHAEEYARLYAQALREIAG